MPPTGRGTGASTGPAAGSTTPPTLRVERQLLRAGLSALGAADEVGRGALSGPATVGIVIVDAGTRPAPRGVRDSKLLTPAARERLVPGIRRWAVASAVGHASPAEIDAIGIIAALRLAGHGALAALPFLPDAVLLDGNHDYLTWPDQASLLEDPPPLDRIPRVITRIKADRACAAVAAASILAKTARDEIMVELGALHPEYCWQDNKGYAAPEHIDALRRLGPTTHHRRSWRLPLAATTVERGRDRESRGPGAVRDRDGADALPGVPRRRRPVLARGRDRAALLSHQ